MVITDLTTTPIDQLSPDEARRQAVMDLLNANFLLSECGDVAILKPQVEQFGIAAGNFLRALQDRDDARAADATALEARLPASEAHRVAQQCVQEAEGAFLLAIAENPNEEEENEQEYSSLHCEQQAALERHNLLKLQWQQAGSPREGESFEKMNNAGIEAGSLARKLNETAQILLLRLLATEEFKALRGKASQAAEAFDAAAVPWRTARRALNAAEAEYAAAEQEIDALIDSLSTQLVTEFAALAARLTKQAAVATSALQSSLGVRKLSEIIASTATDTCH